MAYVGLFVSHKIVSVYVESITRIRRICGKNVCVCVYGEHANSLSECSLTAPIDIKVYISSNDNTNFKIF
jgi:hypothetical protein